MFSQPLLFNIRQKYNSEIVGEPETLGKPVFEPVDGPGIQVAAPDYR